MADKSWKHSTYDGYPAATPAKIQPLKNDFTLQLNNYKIPPLIEIPKNPKASSKANLYFSYEPFAIL